MVQKKVIGKLKSKISLNLSNIPGWQTKRKIIVIESDDWGTIRMRSQTAYNRLLKKGYPVNKNEYNRFDSLESNDDLQLLFDVLNSVKDNGNNPAIITANNIVANPDFKKIEDSNYSKYFYESFTETLLSYPNHNKVIDLYNEGIRAKVIMPQLHGREHINITNWMSALQQKNTAAMDAFSENMFTVAKSSSHSCRSEFLDGFGTFTDDSLLSLQEIVKDASDMFKKIWGFCSASIIAPCYTWHPNAEKYFADNGVLYIQGGRVQKIPKINSSTVKYKRHYTGETNRYKQVYLVRNAFFEPFSNPSKDWIDSCLKEIQNAFFWNKPAIISSHRVNFIGSLVVENRSRNLKLLQELVKRIINKWPDVEFMSSDKLGDLVSQKAL